MEEIKKTRKTKKKAKTPAFLLKRDGKLYVIPDNVMNSVTAEDALRLGLLAIEEQRRQLLHDAVQGDSYINDVKIVDGLEASISKFKEMYPWLKDQIKLYSVSNKIGRA